MDVLNSSVILYLNTTFSRCTFINNTYGLSTRAVEEELLKVKFTA